MNEIAKAQTQARAWNREPIRNTVEEVATILAPMLALFTQTPIGPETIAVYIDMLRDIAPDKLAECVRLCMGECKWLPTVAEIRGHYEEMRQVVPPRLKMEELPELNLNGKLYRETAAERMERIRRIETGSAAVEIKFDLSKYGPGSGCGVCEFGLILPPPARAPVSLYVIRAVQFSKGHLTFCDCEAGRRYKAYLERRLADIRTPKRDHVDGKYWAMILSDAEADTAQPEPPTVHWDGAESADARRRVPAYERAR